MGQEKGHFAQGGWDVLKGDRGNYKDTLNTHNTESSQHKDSSRPLAKARASDAREVLVTQKGQKHLGIHTGVRRTRDE